MTKSFVTILFRWNGNLKVSDQYRFFIISKVCHPFQSTDKMHSLFFIVIIQACRLLQSLITASVFGMDIYFTLKKALYKHLSSGMQSSWGK